MSKRIVIVGAGGVGGNIGARLALAGADVTLIARGETLATLKRDGLTWIDPSGATHRPPVRAVSLDEAGDFDLVLLTLKAHQISTVAESLPRLMGAKAPVVALQNGVPWWYFHKCGGPFDGRRVEAVDPGGHIGSAIDPARVIGAVVYVAASTPAPGTVRVTDFGRLVLGEPDGSTSARLTELAAQLTGAGINTTVSAAIRKDIWIKLWGNLCFNPVSALTRAGLQTIAEDPPVRAVISAIMAETAEVIGRLGVDMGMTIDQRIAITARLGNHKTSTLQDIEAGRAPELDSMVGAVVELARMTQVATPTLDTIYACAGLLARSIQPHNTAHQH